MPDEPDCSIKACNQPVKARGWCRTHYQHWWKYGDPLPKERRPGGVGMPGGTCSVEGCEEPYHCRTWCKSHYWRWRNHGDPLAGSRSPRPNPITTARDAPPGHKLCTKCDSIKPLSEFNRDRTTRDGHRAYCRPCRATFDEEQRARDPEAYMAKGRARGHRHALKRYGITTEQYLTMLEEQGGVCRICGNAETATTPTGRSKALAVDHCHKSNRVRGLLCDACNKGLGAFEDDVVRLTAAIKYLLFPAPVPK